MLQLRVPLSSVIERWRSKLGGGSIFEKKVEVVTNRGNESNSNNVARVEYGNSAKISVGKDDEVEAYELWREQS